MMEEDWKKYVTPLEGECQLGKKPWPEQCCCVCKSLLTDYWYCLRMPQELKPEDGCGCGVVKGYICVCGERRYGNVSGQSGWPHHSGGCECFQKRDTQAI